MKQVCQRTNLTERTVRYYVERGLISPRTETQRGRRYIFFSERDVENLLLIAELRKLLFSIEDIVEILNSPSMISEIIERHYESLDDETKKNQDILAALDQIDAGKIRDAKDLVESLKWISGGYRLPLGDIEPDFGRHDFETEEEKSSLAREAWGDVFGLREKRKRRLKQISILAGVMIIIFFGVFTYSQKTNMRITTITWIPSIEFLDKAIDEDGNYVVDFKVVEPWFEDDELEGIILRSKFTSDISGSVLHNSIITEIEYAMISLRAEMRMKTAKELGVLIEDKSIPELDMGKILGDEKLSKMYTTISNIQGDIN